MGAPKQIIDDRLFVDGIAFRWSERRAPQWSPGHGWVGLVITVEPVEDPQKVLVIEYPMPPGWKPSGVQARRIKRPSTVDNGDFARQVGLALAAGWDPASRGKPFVFGAE